MQLQAFSLGGMTKIAIKMNKAQEMTLKPTRFRFDILTIPPWTIICIIENVPTCLLCGKFDHPPSITLKLQGLPLVEIPAC
jgi:hypothetical protein